MRQRPRRAPPLPGRKSASGQPCGPSNKIRVLSTGRARTSEQSLIVSTRQYGARSSSTCRFFDLGMPPSVAIGRDAPAKGIAPYAAPMTIAASTWEILLPFIGTALGALAGGYISLRIAMTQIANSSEEGLKQRRHEIRIENERVTRKFYDEAHEKMTRTAATALTAFLVNDSERVRQAHFEQMVLLSRLQLYASQEVGESALAVSSWTSDATGRLGSIVEEAKSRVASGTPEGGEGEKLGTALHEAARSMLVAFSPLANRFGMAMQEHLTAILAGEKVELWKTGPES